MEDTAEESTHKPETLAIRPKRISLKGKLREKFSSKPSFGHRVSKKVKFDEPIKDNGQASEESQSRDEKSQKSSIVPSQNGIEYLCREIRQASRTGTASSASSCLGYFTTSFQASTHIGVFIPQKPRSDTFPPSLKLQKLAKLLHRDIANTQDPLRLTESQLNLNLGERRILALILAKGVLQLHDTPWFAQEWDEASILVESGRTGPDKFLQAFISNTFPKDQSIPHASSNSVIRSPRLCALGIQLTQICLGQPLENFHLPEEEVRDLPKSLSDLQTALGALLHVYNLAGVKFRDVVKRCLYCNFETTDFNDEAVRSIFYEKVVKPLEQDVKYFYASI